MLRDRVGIKEELRSSQGLIEEVASKGSDPFEDRKPSTRLQDKQCYDLLEE